MSARHAAVLLAVFLGALVLRVQAVQDRGIIQRDEAWYLFGARGLERRLSDTVAAPPPPTSPLTAGLFGSHNVTGKPLYFSLIWAIQRLRGRYDPYFASLLVSSVAGALNVPATYALARSVGLSSPWALVCSSLAAVSFINLYFSVIGYPHSLLILLNTLAFFFYIESRRLRSPRCAVAAGALWGAGVSAHMSLLLALPGVAASELVVGMASARATAARRWVSLLLGAATVTLFWETAYKFSHLFLNAGPGLVSLSGSYLGDILLHSRTANLPPSPLWERLLFYPLAVLGMEGPLNSAAALFGCLATLRSGPSDPTRARRKMLLVAFIAGLLVLTAYPDHLGRQVALLNSCWPVFATIGLIPVARALADRPHSRALLGTGAVILTLSALYWAAPLLTGEPSGWLKAARWVRSHSRPEDLVVTTEVSNAAILEYYLPGRLLLLRELHGDLPPQARWLVRGPTDHKSAAWREAAPITEKAAPKAVFFDPMEVLKPHLTMSGTWLLLPWWRLAGAPRSYVNGLDDSLTVYELHPPR